MKLKCGIVGLPNVGKSTLFNALTNAGAEVANYPFCTIDPNIGIVELADKRLQALADVVKTKKIIPAIVEFVDIAGLVKGAADNAGLGNRFLSHIRETEGIVHVVRCFEDDNITHVSGGVNPKEDIETINLELILSDLETVKRAITRYQKMAKTGDKESRRFLAVCQKLDEHLCTGLHARALLLDDDEINLINPLCLLTMKPMLYVANAQDNDLNNNPYIKIVSDIAQHENIPVIPICAQTEADIVDWLEEEKLEWLQSLGIEETGLNRLTRAAFDMLGLITFFTAGIKETRAWTIHRETTARKAASVIHKDFERGFIRAEVIDWQTFIDYKGEAGAKEAGKSRSEGQDYLVVDGDVILFRFNV